MSVLYCVNLEQLYLKDMLAFVVYLFCYAEYECQLKLYYGGQKISSVIFPSFQKNRCSPFLIVIMIDVFTCHF
jgi:hypothetical protein